jgi:hypothetical protein
MVAIESTGVNRIPPCNAEPDIAECLVWVERI